MTTVEKLVSVSPVRARRFRVEEFRKMTEAGILPEESGWEIIDGYLIDKMTIGSRHASIVNQLAKILIVLLGDEVIVSIQNPIIVDQFNAPEPDIAVLKTRPDRYADGLPTPADVTILIEVSDSTLPFDRDVKMKLYAESGVREAWLVNLVDETVEQYSSPEHGRYGSVSTFKSGETVNALSIKGLSLEVSEILGR